MALPGMTDPRKLAINIALGITMIVSLAVIVWRHLITSRLDAAIEKTVEASLAGDVAAFESRRESARLLLQDGPDLLPWTVFAYFGVALVLIVLLGRLLAKVRSEKHHRMSATGR